MRTLLGMAMAMISVASAMPATAQSYYAREKIVGLGSGAPEYVATYSSTYSACSGTGTTGTQSAPITSCKLGGKDVAIGSCPQQTKTQECTLPPWRCDALLANRSWPSTGQYTIIGQPGNVTNAQVMCDAYVAGYKRAGICLYLPASGNVAYTTTATTPTTISDPKSYAAGCRLN